MGLEEKSLRIKTIRLCRGHVWKELLFDSFGQIVAYTNLGKIKRYDLKNLKIIFLTLFYKME